MTRIAVVGAGSWGTALAVTLARSGDPVTLWSRNAALAEELTATRTASTYLAGTKLADSVVVTTDLAAIAGAEIVILAVPTHGMRDIATRVKEHVSSGAVVVSAAKGFEVETGLTMTQTLADVLGDSIPVAALSGPNIAPEIAAGLPAATVVAATDADVAARVRDILNGKQLRVYSNDDVLGVEYGGALKNVVAIAAGVCDGIGGGDNGKAAIITRGLAEMARLGAAAGANPITFAGLTGLGDCVVTCMSPFSRNRRLGEALGRGETLEVASQGSMVAEGVNATRAAVVLAQHLGVDMPIAAQVHAVLFEGRTVADALTGLMTRGAAAEMRGLGLEALAPDTGHSPAER